jgi:peroxiredoxin
MFMNKLKTTALLLLRLFGLSSRQRCHVLLVGFRLLCFSQMLAEQSAECAECRQQESATPNQATKPEKGLDAKLPTVEQLYQHLQRTRRQLENCRVVVANRGDQNQLNTDENIHPNVWFTDTWLSGDNAQQHWMVRPANGQTPWWTGFKLVDKPFTTATVSQLEGGLFCVRDSGNVQCADLGPAYRSDRLLYPILYSASQTARQPPLTPFVPLAMHNRKWNPYSGGASAVDSIAQLPLSRWKVLRFDQLGDTKVVLVEVTKEPKGRAVLAKRHSGTLTIMPIWLAWFSLEPTYFPLKVESAAWYEWQGKRYDFERTEYSVIQRFTAGDLTDYGSGFWFPRSGSEKTFYPKDKAPPFDVDSLVDNLLKNGKAIRRDKLVLSTHREWQVLKLQAIDPKTSLWIDPPKGACVLTLETGARRIEGLTEEESRKLLNIPPNQKYVKAGDPAPDFDVTTLEGKTLRLKDLRGKFVLLDFWATWCPPCVASIPQLQAVYEQFKDDKRFVMLGLSLDDDKDILGKFLKDNKLSWPQVRLGGSRNSDLCLQYGVSGAPSYLLIGPDGKILKINLDMHYLTHKEGLLELIASYDKLKDK